jgi:hypothetical protein
VAGAVALCINDGGVPGPCAGLTPAQIITKVIGGASAAETSANGFTGDPMHVVKGKYFGPLLSVSGY